MNTALDVRVAAGAMTQAQEDELLNVMNNRHEACLGAGNGYGMMGVQNRLGYGIKDTQNGIGSDFKATKS